MMINACNEGLPFDDGPSLNQLLERAGGSSPVLLTARDVVFVQRRDQVRTRSCALDAGRTEITVPVVITTAHVHGYQPQRGERLVSASQLTEATQQAALLALNRQRLQHI